MNVSRETYTCDVCGRTYEKTRPDAEAMAEMRTAFGDTLPETIATVCDDCFQRFQRWLAQQPKN